MAENDLQLMSRATLPGAPAIQPGPPPAMRRDLSKVLLVAGGLALALGVLSVWAFTQLPPAMKRGRTPFAPSPGMPWLQAFSWWDGAWYVDIARHGYWWEPGRQSPVAFFPAYPLLMRAVSVATRDMVLAGVVTTLACGLGVAVTFFRWCRERIGRSQAWTALAVLLAYPCSFYLFATIYADALFVLLAVGAFLLLERDRPGWAGLVAAVASATRPTGLAVVVGLWARAVERRGVHPSGLLGGLRALRPDRCLLLAPLGVIAFAGYLGGRFGEPLAFVKAEAARGWRQAPGWNTWLKVSWWERISRPPFWDPPHYHLFLHALVTVVVLVLVVFVFRRLGWGYGVYSLVLVLGAALSTKDFVGMGRYTLAAFPCFAVAGDLLWPRPRLRAGVIAVLAGMLLLFTELHARNMLIS